MASACHNCDRPTCALLTLPKPPYGAEADDWNAADADCRAHAVDWRAETMRLRDTLAQVRAAIPAGSTCYEGCNASDAIEAVAGILGEVGHG